MITRIVPLRNLTTIKQRGQIRLGVVTSFEEINEIEDKRLIIGRGSNVVIKDAYMLYKLSDEFNYIIKDENTLRIGASTKVSSLISFCIEKGLSSLEFLAGVPATIGGAVYMNAGAFGKEIKEVIKYIKVLEDNKTYYINSDNFTYRRSNIKGVITEVGLKYRKYSKDYIFDRVREVVKSRLKRAHLTNTFGSVFKNPKEKPAGWLLEESGLKGYAFNSVMFSYKHANYMVSNGNANIDDILFLIDKAKSSVMKNFGIELEEEVIII